MTESVWNARKWIFCKRADYIIDTSHLLTRELRQEIEKIFVNNEKFCNMMVTVLSFGFKYGIPADADLVFDVRFLPNPYYEDELRPLTGMDESVFNYVMDNETARIFANKLEDMVEFLIPKYAQEGKTSLVIAVGCTGASTVPLPLQGSCTAGLPEMVNTVFDWSTEMWIKIAY